MYLCLEYVVNPKMYFLFRVLSKPKNVSSMNYLKFKMDLVTKLYLDTRKWKENGVENNTWTSKIAWIAIH